MNRSLLSRIMPFLLAFYALSFAAFFIYAVLTFSATAYLPALRWEFALKRAFVLFMDYLIPVHAAAVAVAASLSSNDARQRPGAGRPFSKIVSSALVAFIVLTAAYTALAEGVAPRARARLADMQYLSRVAGEYKRQTASAMQSKDYHAALDAIDRYLEVDPGNKQFAEERLRAASGAARQAVPAPAQVAAGDTSSIDQTDAQALVEKARFYVAQKDWFSAHYYAQAAVAKDPRRIDAMQIASQANNELARLTQDDKNKQSAELFQRKKDALGRLESGDALGAYYAFLALSANNKNDPDIARSLAEAVKAVRGSAFFLDDARKLEAVPGTQGILFLNRNDAESTEAVSLGKMVELPGGDAFFFDIEAVRYDAAGNVAWHFNAPYGRREGDSILMQAVDRTDPTVRLLPLYLQGTRPLPERFLLRLVPTVDELRALSSSRTALAGMSIGEMWGLRGKLGAYGLARQSLSVEMTMRLVMPFAFLILSLMCTAMGWALRMRSGEKLPAAGIILMPLLPVVLALMSLLYLQAHRIIIGFAVIGFGLAVAFVALAVLQVLLLALSLVLLAGQSN